MLKGLVGAALYDSGVRSRGPVNDFSCQGTNLALLKMAFRASGGRISSQLTLQGHQLAFRSAGRRGAVRFYSAAPLERSIPAAKKKYVPTTGTYPQGFRASGTVVGVKPGNTTKPDLALISSDRPCAAAAVFTKNKFQAAPVTFSRELLKRKKNRGIQGVIINSGCANAVTGKGGLEDAAKMAAEADKCLGAHEATIVMSTGVIGQRHVVPTPRVRRPALTCIFKAADR